MFSIRTYSIRTCSIRTCSIRTCSIRTCSIQTCSIQTCSIRTCSIRTCSIRTCSIRTCWRARKISKTFPNCIRPVKWREFRIFKWMMRQQVRIVEKDFLSKSKFKWQAYFFSSLFILDVATLSLKEHKLFSVTYNFM